MPEMQDWFLGWEDPLKEKMATRSSILAWRIPWTEEPGGLQSVGSQRVGHDYACTHTSFSEPFLLCLLFSLLQGETHTLPLAHTHTLAVLLVVSVSLSTVLPNRHTLCPSHTLSHTTSAVCFAGVLVQEWRRTSVLLVPVKWCVEPRETHLSWPHEDAAAPVLRWANTACSLEMGKCGNWRSLRMVKPLVKP